MKREVLPEELCPVCATADLVCAKWTILVIRDLAGGCSRFCELERSLAGISPRTLSLRLRALEEHGIVDRRTYPEVPPRVEYELTRLGASMGNPMKGLANWAMANAESVESSRERYDAVNS